MQSDASNPICCKYLLCLDGGPSSVEDSLDVMRLDAEVDHAGRDGASNIMKVPRLHRVAEAFVEVLFAFLP